MHMEKDGAANDGKELIQGNLQAAQNVHYALSTFCKLEKQLIWHAVFESQDKEKGYEESCGGGEAPWMGSKMKGQEPGYSRFLEETGIGKEITFAWW